MKIKDLIRELSEFDENLDIELPPKCVFAFLCLTQSMCFRYKTYINIMKSLFIKYVAYATPYKGINFFTG